MGLLRAVLDPDRYHGFGQESPFFEGWYYKIISKDQESKFAVIPGIILGPNGHAFIQMWDGSTGDSIYRTFPQDSFIASKNHFEVNIPGNSFTKNRIHLDLDFQQGLIQGELNFHGIIPWPVSVISPGIMGWYSWVPRMETYHGVVSLDHTINGHLHIDNEEIDFNSGRGYIEKDWRASFPEAYIWFQSNHFEQLNTSLTASVAIIPWLRNASHPKGGVLLGPDRVEMGKRINETMSSTVEVRLSTLSGVNVFSDIGNHARLEAHGEPDRLLSLN